MKEIEPLSQSEVHRHLRPYALQIGLASLAWNGLHENLGILFWYALGPQLGRVSWSMWHRLSNDRTQRMVLKEAVAADAFSVMRNGKRITEDLLWLLEQADALADRRNIAIHAPITILTDMRTGEARVEAQDFFGNKRAKSLAKKESILEELKECCEKIERISTFSADLIKHLNSADKWPERPFL